MGKSKKNKKDNKGTTSNETRRKPPMMLPDMAMVDTLSMMTDEELFERFRKLDEERTRFESGGYSVREWEEEIAFLQREDQLRQTRVARQREYEHEMYREYEEQESTLQFVSDEEHQVSLDNSQFTRASDYRDSLKYQHQQRN